MIDDEFETFTYSHAITAVFLIALGWGILWSGNQGAKVVLNMLDRDEVQYNSKTLTAGVKNASNISSASLTVMVGGDVIFDRRVRFLGEQFDYESLLTEVASLFKTADIAMVNLEGPITNNKSLTLLPNKTTTKSFTFTFDPVTAKALYNSGVTLVNLANNHTDNFGIAGLNETKKHLGKADVEWFGSPWNGTGTEAVISKNGITVAFVGYHAFQKGFDRIVADVKRLSSEDKFVIVMPHWGEEYVSTHSEDQMSKARILVAAGADAIIGSHPHVIMDNIWMGDVPVYFSLGNLLFDQYFSPEVMRGNIIEMHIVSGEKEAVLDSIKVHEVSMASKKGVSLVKEGVTP